MSFSQLQETSLAGRRGNIPCLILYQWNQGIGGGNGSISEKMSLFCVAVIR